MRGVVLLAVLAACAVEVDPNNTRFRCADEPVCPDGFTCVSGSCEPIGAVADAAAGVPDAAADPPDAEPGTPDAPPRPSCDELYGEVPGYVLCEELETTCSFNALLEGGTCGALCPMYGGTCEGALDNENGVGQECIPIAVETCADARTSEICICSR